MSAQSYVLRNTVLQIMGDTITSELSAEQLSDELKEIRDEFLEDLHNHILDVSAHVRSKSLQIWSQLRAENSVPLVWQHRVLLAAAERLDDRATLVRKNAVLLIKAFLETNPFAAKLSLLELTDKYAVEEARLQEIRSRMLAVEEREQQMQEHWQTIADEAMAVIAADLAANPLSEQSAAPTTNSESSGLAAQILQLLLDGEVQRAFQLLRSVGTPNVAELCAMPVEQQVQYFAVLLRSYMFLNQDHVSDIRNTSKIIHPLISI